MEKGYKRVLKKEWTQVGCTYLTVSIHVDPLNIPNEKRIDQKSVTKHKKWIAFLAKQQQQTTPPHTHTILSILYRVN